MLEARCGSDMESSASCDQMEPIRVRCWSARYRNRVLSRGRPCETAKLVRTGRSATDAQLPSAEPSLWSADWPAGKGRCLISLWCNGRERDAWPGSERGENGRRSLLPPRTRACIVVLRLAASWPARLSVSKTAMRL